MVDSQDLPSFESQHVVSCPLRDSSDIFGRCALKDKVSIPAWASVVILYLNSAKPSVHICELAYPVTAKLTNIISNRNIVVDSTTVDGFNDNVGCDHRTFSIFLTEAYLALAGPPPLARVL